MGFPEDYVSVSTRISEFYERYPEGSIQTEIVTRTDSLVVVKAYAYRSPDDPRPSIGHSQLGIPGKTNYTRDSELENCETSAVGRALAFLGFSARENIASREEVESRQGEPAAKHPATHAGVQAIRNVIQKGPKQGTRPDLIKEATAIALGARPSEINSDIFDDYVGAWLEQAGNTVSAFQRKFMAALGELVEREQTA